LDCALRHFEKVVIVLGAEVDDGVAGRILTLADHRVDLAVDEEAGIALDARTLEIRAHLGLLVGVDSTRIVDSVASGRSVADA
jgi:hypothetical protein